MANGTSVIESIGIIEAHIGERTVKVPAGTKVADLLTARKDSAGRPYLAAIINNHLVDLETPLFGPTQISPVTIASREGAAVFRRTATLILYQAARDLFPKMRLTIGQSLGSGYHFAARVDDQDISPAQAELLEQRVRGLIAEDRPIKRSIVPVEEAEALFNRLGLIDKVLLLKNWRNPDVRLYSCGTYQDIQHGPVAPTTGCVSDFTLTHYPPGFVVEFPSVIGESGEPTQRPQDQVMLFRTYQETRRWNEILGVSTIGQLNELVLDGGVRDVIRVAEGFHEKGIARIADQIAERRGAARVILIAGPSSAGKTTFAKRLSIQLRVNGIRPLALSMDNYYVDRDDTPRHPDGSFDFEALEAVDIGLFNQQLVALMAGTTVRTPVFDFNLGRRKPESEWVPVTLEPDQVIMIEGIHGNNPRLTAALPPEQKFRVFINALTQLSIDHSNRIFTSEARLLRRIVRDRRYRGYSAAQSINGWPSVRLGERRHIFPFQEQADAMFNTALVYEPAVLKVFAERYLFEVPRDHPSAVTAYSLIKFLDLFVPLLPDDVPQTSILREFIGGSAFNY